MKTLTLASLLFGSCALFLSYCTTVNKEAPAINAVLDSLRQSYAPDDRIAVFDMSAQEQGNVLVVKGEVDNPKAKEATMTAVGRSFKGTVLDSDALLPDP